MATTVERLTARLTEQGFTPVAAPERIYAGYWQRAGGAWSWSCYADAVEGKVYPDSRAGRIFIGSPVNMSTLLKCRHQWTGFKCRGSSDFEIHPCDECARV